MKKRSVRIIVALAVAVLLTAALSACVGGTDTLTFTALTVVKNGSAAEEITFTEGEKIAYSDYQLRIDVSDGSALVAELAESHFNPKELAALYEKTGNTKQTMSLTFQSGGQIIQGLIAVRILKPDVEEVTYTLKYVMERDYAEYQFAPTTGISRITSLAERHTDMPQYFRIEWRTVLEDPSTKIVLPYRLTSDLTIYGKVVDDRVYTVRFWKDFDGTNYQNQIGDDVSNLKYDEKVLFPTSGYDKVGYRFAEWKREGKSFTETESLGGYFYIKDEFVSYPNVQIVNVYAVYTLNRYDIAFRYLDETGRLTEFPTEFPDYAGTKSVPHGAVLSIGSEFAESDAGLIFTAPPNVMGMGFSGSWYYRNDDGTEIAFPAGETRIARSDMTIYAKYERRTLNIRFFSYEQRELKHMEIEYGAVIAESDYPAHNAQDGYRFEWDGRGTDLNEGVTESFDIYETRIALPYRHIFYYDTAAGRQTVEGTSDFNTDFNLWDLDEIKSKLGGDYRAYLEYGWYGSDAADPERDAPLALRVTQTAGTMSFYLKTKDLRRYTVYYYTKLGDSGIVSENYVTTETVRFAENADFDASRYPVNGWSANSIASFDDGSILSTGLGFVPSGQFSEDKTEFFINVVVVYRRNTYRLELFEPIFGTTEKTLYAALDAVEYETVLNSIAELRDYNTADRTVDSETYRFYGWFLGETPVDLATTSMLTATSLDAKWVALSEGTFGIRYETANDGAGDYAVAVGYEGDAAEFIIGSKYRTGGVEYPVKKIGIVVVEGKNRSARKVTIPATVEQIAPGAFIDFYGVEEYEAAVGSAKFASRDGVLYSKDYTALVAYPRKKAGDFNVPKEVTRIAESAFLGYSAANLSFETGSELKTLGRSSFANASGMTTVLLPDGLEAIETGAFVGCAALTTVNYGGNSLKIVGAGAFEGTPYFVNAQDGALMLGGVLIKIVGTVSEDYVLDDKVTAIAAGAFAGAEVKTVTAGESSVLGYVGDGGFSNLSSFTVKSETTVVEFDKTTYVFDGTAMNFRIYVPAGKLEAYEILYENTEYDGDFSGITG